MEVYSQRSVRVLALLLAAMLAAAKVGCGQSPPPTVQPACVPELPEQSNPVPHSLSPEEQSSREAWEKIASFLESSQDSQLFMKVESTGAADSIWLPQQWPSKLTELMQMYADANQSAIAEYRSTPHIELAPISFTPEIVPESWGQAATRDLLRRLRLDAYFASRRQQYDIAIQDIVTQIKLFNASGSHTLLVGQFVRMDHWDIILSTIRDSIPATYWQRKDVESLVTLIQKTDEKEALISSIRIEIEVDRNPAKFPRLSGDGRFADISRRFGKMLDALSLPWHQALSTGLASPPKRPLVEAISLGMAEMQSSKDVTILGILVEMYKCENGRYPDSIESLLGEHLTEMPQDVFTGMRYIYEFDDKKFMLYGVGRNRQDNGGTSDRVDGDIVWRGSDMKVDDFILQQWSDNEIEQLMKYPLIAHD